MIIAPATAPGVKKELGARKQMKQLVAEVKKAIREGKISQLNQSNEELAHVAAQK